MLIIGFISVNIYAENMPDVVDAGVKAYNQEDFSIALKDFSIAAKAGDAQAQNNLGVYYLRKLPHVDENYKQAYVWLAKSASQNNKMGYYNLAYIYINGKAIKPNIKKGISLYKKSAALNYVKAQNQLGFIYYQGRTEQQDFEQAYLYFSLAAQNEDATSASMLSVLSKQMTPQQLKQANTLVKNYKFASTD
tara:strand:+ start:9147 stop:9722 length:576 start_codon:yes stop_codon:yes gene_type:complete